MIDPQTLHERLEPIAAVTPIPLLALRVVELERVAWREGRPAAKRLERRAARALGDAARTTLRRRDILAHAQESDTFLAVLAAPTREGGASATAGDCRAALARLASRLEHALGSAIETGWTLLERGTERSIGACIAEALGRGSRERERFDFFSAIGHELRTPLSSIRGYLETLLDDRLEPAVQRRFVEIAYTESLRLGRLVEGMFEVSLLDQSAFNGRATSDPHAGIATALGVVCPLAERRGTTIQTALAPCGPVEIATDRLVQVLINVLENAVKHGREAGKIVLALRCDGPRVARIAVDDDGPGVSEDDRECIFEFLRRGRTVATGTGIGLAVVRMILERHGGSIDVGHSSLGGASFAMTIPIHEG